jgi:hypothetical protein
MRLLLVLSALCLSGCQWALIHYRGEARVSEALACFPMKEEPNALECFDYVQQLHRDGVVVVPKPRNEQRL